MCFVCERKTEPSRGEILDEFRDRIAEHGWIITGKVTAEGEPTHLYTAGLTNRGWPELFLGALIPTETAHHILNVVALKAVALGRAPAVGERVLIDHEDRRFEVTITEYHRLKGMNVVNALYPHRSLQALRVRLDDAALEQARASSRS